MSHSRPTHYSRYKPQPVEVIENWNLPFHLANVVKYIARAPHKENELKDLRKAKWYLERWIDVLEARAKGTNAPPPQDQV